MEQWLLLENGSLLYVPAVTNVEFMQAGQHEGKAICYGFGVLICSESRIAGEYFGKIRDEILGKREAAKPETESASGQVEQGT